MRKHEILSKLHTNWTCDFFIELVSKDVNEMLYNNNIKINKIPYELVSIDGI